MPSTAEFRNGMTLILDGALFTIVEFQHVKPGKGGAFVRTRLKNVKTGRVIDRTFRSGEKFEEARLEEKEMQFLYSSGDHYFFMDTATYEQAQLGEDVVGDAKKYLKEGNNATVVFYGTNVIGVEIPFFVQLEVVKTDPGLKGDTASGGSKAATLETGAVIQVPLFIREGEKLKVDTRTGTYVERVK